MKYFKNLVFSGLLLVMILFSIAEVSAAENPSNSFESQATIELIDDKNNLFDNHGKLPQTNELVNYSLILLGAFTLSFCVFIGHKKYQRGSDK
ncbi:LPXTG cell wall anchor domain-containing protein [Enterococcus sp. LJL120]